MHISPLIELHALLWIAAIFCLVVALWGPGAARRRRARLRFRRSLWAPRPRTIFFIGLAGAVLLSLASLRV